MCEIVISYLWKCRVEYAIFETFDQLINIRVRVRFRPFWLENPLTMISACLLEAKLASTSQDLEPKNVRYN